MFMALGGLILLALWVITGTAEISTLNTLFSTANNILVSFLFLTLVCTAVGYAIFYWLLGSTTPSLANTFAYIVPVSYTHLRAHETPEHLVCRLLLEKKKHIT